jgi:hypothetical protein
VRSDGVELCRHRTKTINCSTNDIDLNEFVVVSVSSSWFELLKFTTLQSSLKEIHDITVIVGFFCMQGFLRKRTLLGWIRLGADEVESADGKFCYNSIDRSKFLAAEHWMQMVQDIGRPVERWHTLRRPRNMTL